MIATREDLHGILSTCEAVLLAKNEEIDALRATVAEKEALIQELALLLAWRERQVAAVLQVQDAGLPSSPKNESAGDAQRERVAVEGVETPDRRDVA